MLTRNVTFRDEPASPVAATACQGDSDGRAGSTATSSNEPLNFLNTAVAAEEEDSLSACESLVGTSVAGDSVVDSSDAEGKDKTPTAAAARRQKKRRRNSRPLEVVPSANTGSKTVNPKWAISAFTSATGEKEVLSKRGNRRSEEKPWTNSS